MRESKTYMAILEEGKQAGLAEGLQIGRMEGLQSGLERGLNEGVQKGRVEALQETLLQIGTEQWGEPDAESAKRLSQIADPARLQRQIARCHHASGWSELFSQANGK